MAITASTRCRCGFTKRLMFRMLAASASSFLLSCPMRHPMRFFRQTLIPFSKWVLSFGRLISRSASTPSRATDAPTPPSKTIGNGSA